MCGIAGLTGPRRDTVIEAMTRALAHRGPDDEGFYHDGDIALGQRRLSIIDLSSGHQPIANEDESLWLVCNGEIYNSPGLRSELESKGHRFRTHTDVEVILHLYEEHGRDCVQKLQGMFAFALWDTRRRGLLLARDHLGQKPLFYSRVEGHFLFASEVKAILAADLVERQPDLEAIWHYVSMRFIPDHMTLFKGVDKLPAAHALWHDEKGVELWRYWAPDFNSKRKGSESELIDGLEAVLDETVASHMLSDVRVGAFLSGGIDSSTVAALMARHSDSQVPVFSIGVKEQDINELPWARMVVERYGLEGHEQVVEADMIHLIPSMIAAMDEPADPFGVGVYLVSRIAREHVKVVLTGDGGDESFAGYDRYAGQRVADYYALLPAWFRRHVMGALVRRIPESFGYKSVAQKARWLNEVSFFTAGDRYAHSMAILRFTQEMKSQLFTPAARAGIEVANSHEKILKWFDAANADQLVDRMLYTDLMTRIPDHLLVIADRMSMAHSLETRAPLLDYRLVEYAASLPVDLKLRGMQLKYALRKVASRHLPQELIDRPKQGFGFPIARWLRTELSTFLRRLFAESRFVELGLFDPGYIDLLLTEHLDGRADHNFRLWILLNLELWYRLYFEGETIDSMREYTDRLAA